MARILVVERDAKIRELLSRLLGVKGHEVTTAVDGATGMQLFIAERPDLMLVELQLADMTGIELCRAVRETQLDVRVVLMGTARQARRSSVEGTREALDVPLFLVKPFGIDALMAAVEAGANGPDGEGARARLGRASTAPLPSARPGTAPLPSARAGTAPIPVSGVASEGGGMSGAWVTAPASTVLIASPAIASLAIASPAIASPAIASPVIASPAIASPVIASPVIASPAIASPVIASPVIASAIASPVIASPVIEPAAMDATRSSASSPPPGIAAVPVAAPTAVSPAGQALAAAAVFDDDAFWRTDEQPVAALIAEVAAEKAAEVAAEAAAERATERAPRSPAPPDARATVSDTAPVGHSEPDFEPDFDPDFESGFEPDGESDSDLDLHLDLGLGLDYAPGSGAGSTRGTGPIPGPVAGLIPGTTRSTGPIPALVAGATRSTGPIPAVIAGATRTTGSMPALIAGVTRSTGPLPTLVPIAAPARSTGPIPSPIPVIIAGATRGTGPLPAPIAAPGASRRTAPLPTVSAAPSPASAGVAAPAAAAAAAAVAAAVATPAPEPIRSAAPAPAPAPAPEPIRSSAPAPAPASAPPRPATPTPAPRAVRYPTPQPSPVAPFDRDPDPDTYLDDDDLDASYGASSSGGLLAAESIEIVPPATPFDPLPRSRSLETVYALDEASDDRHTWGVDSLQMEAIRHGPVNLEEDERRYTLEPMVPQAPSDPRGIYGPVTLPQLLYRCFSDLFTGRLLIRRGPVRKQILLANGRPIGAESNIRSESLGFLLLRDGVIDQAQLRQSVRIARQFGIRQGEALVRMGAITAEAMPDYLRRQLRSRLLGCFAWNGAEYGLKYEPDVRATLEAVELNPLVLIFDGIKTSFPVAPLVHHFDDRNRSPVRVTERLRDYTTMLRPFADDLRVATLCDGQRTLGEVLSVSPFSLIDSLRILRALEITGCIDFGPARALDAALDRPATLTPRAAVTGGMSPIGGSVGGSVGGSLDGATSTPRRTRRVTTDTAPGSETVDVADSEDDMPSEADLERSRRLAARRRRTRRTHTGPDLVQAETNFSKGKRALDAEDLAEALSHFALACRQDPHEPLYRMYNAWTRYQSAPATDRKARAEAFDELKATVDAAPDHDEGHVLLGHIQRMLGNAEAAQKHYRKAIALNRRNPAANRALREMEGQRSLQERDAAGLFGKFFTRR